jgi:hypothetical protein
VGSEYRRHVAKASIRAHLLQQLRYLLGTMSRTTGTLRPLLRPPDVHLSVIFHLTITKGQPFTRFDARFDDSDFAAVHSTEDGVAKGGVDVVGRIAFG